MAGKSDWKRAVDAEVLPVTKSLMELNTHPPFGLLASFVLYRCAPN